MFYEAVRYHGDMDIVKWGRTERLRYTLWKPGVKIAYIYCQTVCLRSGWSAIPNVITGLRDVVS